ncbi:MAG: methyltransferase [Desulfuromonadaceae bacterium]
MKILPSDNSYRTFCDLVGGYRMFRVMTEAVNAGIIDRLDDADYSVAELLAVIAFQPEEGRRFLETLVSVGLLEEHDGRLFLSRFSRTFLTRSSPAGQRRVLEFEPVLMDNWGRLGEVLREGQVASVREQPQEGYHRRLELFQGAMSEAAAVRSCELWDALKELAERGTIIDIGAGEGIYLREFLARHPEWQGIACELPDVCAQAASTALPHNLTFYPVNILERQELAALVARHRGTADLLLFSNLCHCYSPEENCALMEQASALLADDGLLVVHDFHRDANSFGALYDLHMLVNTWNGRSYASAETAALLAGAGFPHHSIVELPSSSTAIVATRTVPYRRCLP